MALNSPLAMAFLYLSSSLLLVQKMLPLHTLSSCAGSRLWHETRTSAALPWAASPRRTCSTC